MKHKELEKAKDWEVRREILSYVKDTGRYGWSGVVITLIGALIGVFHIWVGFIVFSIGMLWVVFALFCGVYEGICKLILEVRELKIEIRKGGLDR